MRLKLILALLYAPLGALAEDMPQRPANGIADLAGLLSASEEVQLQAVIGEMRHETGVELILVTMGRMADHGGSGQSLEDYATLLFNSWGIGDADRDDGIMLLVASGDRATRIELGSGIPAAYDARAQDIIDRVMLPKFREGQMSLGIKDAIVNIKDKIARPFAEGRWVGLADQWPTALIGLGIFGAVFGAIRIGKAAWAAYVRCPRCGQPGLTRVHEVIVAATTSSSGSGITHLTCRLCNHTEDRSYTISPISDTTNHSHSSGSGSGGGGSSSGGGASGRW